MGFFGQLLGTGQRPLIGVDISASRVKLVELDGSAGAYRVLAFASEALPAEAVADHQISDPESVAAAVSRALTRTGSRTRNAAIAVSGPSVISKIIDMPAELGEQEIEQQIGFDAEQYIPHAIEDVNLDFQVLERDPDNPGSNRVLLVACRRDHIDTRVGALEMAGMKVRIVDVEEYALQNACSLLIEHSELLGGEARIAVFDVGAQQTRLSVQQAARSVYSRELSFGGHAFAQRLIERYDLTDIDQLRARLRTHEISAEDIADFADRLSSQIERALQFYISAAARDESIDHIVLVGGAMLYPGLEAALRERMAWPLSVGNPLAGMLASAAARRNHVEQQGPALMVAVGLAMRAGR